jgi:hypothetical protein
MSTITRYYNNEPDNVTKWAQENLTPEELSSFNSAWQENLDLWTSYRVNGLLTVTPIYESIYVEELTTNVDIQVGETITLAPGISQQDITVAPSWDYWLTRLNPDILTDKLIYS